MKNTFIKTFVLAFLVVFFIGMPFLRNIELPTLSDSDSPGEPEKMEVKPEKKAPVSTRPPAPPEVAPKDAIQDKGTPVRELADSLVAAGWSRETVEAVTTLNENFFTHISENLPAFAGRLQVLLGDLGRTPSIMEFLRKHPESAGLFTVVEQPESLLELLTESETYYPTMALALSLQISRADAENSLQALQQNKNLIHELYRRGLPASQVLFHYGQEPDIRLTYNSWVKEVLKNKLDAPDHVLASTVHMILKYGNEIRSRMKTDQQFRTDFMDIIWPKFVRLAAEYNHMFELFLDDPRIWDLLMLPEGEQLIREKGVLVPIDLLYGYPHLNRSPYPKHLHYNVIQNLLHGNELTIQALIKFRDEPLFHKFMQRPLPPDIRTAAINRLFKAGSAYPALLAEYNRITLSGLKDEVGPPPSSLTLWAPFYYTIWEVPKKLAQGRNPSKTEWINSIADPASFILPVLKFGVAALNFGKFVSGMIPEKKAQDSFIKEEGLHIARRQLQDTLAARLADEELVRFGITAMLTKMQTAMPEAVEKKIPFDLTRPVRFMLSYSGIGSSTLRNMKILGAGIILTGDKATFTINSALDPKLRDYFNNTAALYTKNPENLRPWRQNISAWWLIHAGGLLSALPD